MITDSNHSNSRDAGAPLRDLPGVASTRRWWTVPNILCAIRLVASLGLIPLAAAGLPEWALALFLTLMATDWLDGKLAIWLDQRTSWGARLDSVADAAMYAAMLVAGIVLFGPLLLTESPWIAAALLTYLASCAAALARFRKLPSYHTWTAKFGWLLMNLAVVSLFMGWSLWPLRLAMLGVALANLEAFTITLTLARWRTDVRSLRTARKLRAETARRGTF